MDSSGKRTSPYHGFWAVLLVLILVPAVFVLLLHAVLNRFSTSSAALNAATARAMGLGLGFVFHLMCMISGAFRKGWEAVKRRWHDFFDNLIVGIGYAFSAYWDDVLEEGVTFIICMLIIGLNLALAIQSLIAALALIF